MATQVFLLDTVPSTHRGTNTANLVGTAQGWRPLGTGTSRGSGIVASASLNTVTGPTAGIETAQAATLLPLEWLTPPVDQDVTISGTITANVWASESGMNANVAINVRIDKVSAVDGTITEIVRSTRTTEVAVTTRAANNFTTGMTSGAYTGVSLSKGDRLRITVFADDAGTMGGSFNFNTSYNGATAAADGDTFITFNETFGFQEQDGGNILTGNTIAPDGADPFGTTASIRVAQSFQLGALKSVGSVDLMLRKSGAPTDNVVISIQADSSGVPSGTPLASATLDGATLTTTMTHTHVPFESPVLLTGSTTYWLVLERSGATSDTNFYQYEWDNAGNPYANGAHIRDSGTWSSPGTNDLWFLVLEETFTVYLTNTVSDVSTADRDWEAWTARGNAADEQTCGVVSAGWKSPQQAFLPSGTATSWWTRPLKAFTLSGLVKCSIRVRQLSSTGNNSFGVEIARTNGDGTSATVWGYANRDASTADGAAGEISPTSETAYTVYVSGDDLAVSDGQRLRIRLFSEDSADAAASGTVQVLFTFDGPTEGASGDTFIILPQALEEFISTAHLPSANVRPLPFFGRPPILATQEFESPPPAVTVTASATLRSTHRLTATGVQVQEQAVHPPQHPPLLVTSQGPPILVQQREFGVDTFVKAVALKDAGRVIVAATQIALSAQSIRGRGRVSASGTQIASSAATLRDHGHSTTNRTQIALAASTTRSKGRSTATSQQEEKQTVTFPSLQPLLVKTQGPPLLVTQKEFGEGVAGLVTSPPASIRARSRATTAALQIALAASATRTKGHVTTNRLQIALGQSTTRTKGRATTNRLQIALGTISARARGRTTVNRLQIALAAIVTRSAGRSASTSQQEERQHVLPPQHQPLLLTMQGPPILTMQKEFGEGVVGLVTSPPAILRGKSRTTVNRLQIALAAEVTRTKGHVTVNRLQIALGQSVQRADSRSTTSAVVIVTTAAALRAKGRTTTNRLQIALAASTTRTKGKVTANRLQIALAASVIRGDSRTSANRLQIALATSALRADSRVTSTSTTQTEEIQTIARQLLPPLLVKSQGPPVLVHQRDPQPPINFASIVTRTKGRIKATALQIAISSASLRDSGRVTTSRLQIAIASAIIRDSGKATARVTQIAIVSVAFRDQGRTTSFAARIISRTATIRGESRTKVLVDVLVPTPTEKHPIYEVMKDADMYLVVQDVHEVVGDDGTEVTAT